MRKEQKEQELFFVRRAFAALGLDPTALASAGPAPDCEAVFADRRIGVEVTSAFRDSVEARPRQAEETERRKVVDMARELWEERGAEPVLVGTYFNSQHGIRSGDRRRLAEALVTMVAGHAPSHGALTLEYDWFNRKWFPEEFGFVRIYKSPLLKKPEWVSPDASYVPLLSREVIQKCIAGKSLADYRTGYDEAWLLIVLDSFRHSGTFRIPPDAVDPPYPSDFDRILLLDAFPARIWDIGDPCYPLAS